MADPQWLDWDQCRRVLNALGFFGRQGTARMLDVFRRTNPDGSVAFIPLGFERLLEDRVEVHTSAAYLEGHGLDPAAVQEAIASVRGER